MNIAYWLAQVGARMSTSDTAHILTSRPDNLGTVS